MNHDRFAPRTSGRRRTIMTIAIGLACMMLLSGCFLRSIVGYVDERGGATLSGNVEVSFCNFDAFLGDTPLYGCNYRINDEEGFLIDYTSTFELVTEFGVFGLIVDPLILQVPADASNVVATYNNAGADLPLDVTDTTTFPVTPTTTVTAEPGTKFLILELPDAVVQSLPSGGADFDFALSFDVADPTNLFVKPMLTGAVDQGGTRYYVPILPCVTDFATIPAIQIPQAATFQFLNPAIAANAAAFVPCNGTIYDLRVAGPGPSPTAPPDPTAPPPATGTGSSSSAAVIEPARTAVCIESELVQGDPRAASLGVGSEFIGSVDQVHYRIVSGAPGCSFDCAMGFDANCDGALTDFCPAGVDRTTVAGVKACLAALAPASETPLFTAQSVPLDPAATDPGAALALTGIDADELALAGFALVAAGSLAVAFGRRPRRDRPSS